MTLSQGQTSPRLERPLASYIDHTLLRPTATRAEIEKTCRDAAAYKCAATCVNSTWVPFAHKILEGSGVSVCTVVGFPLGAASTGAKLAETHEAIHNGAKEIDMVINIGWLKGGEHDHVRHQIAALADACHEQGAKLKVIVETGLLTQDEKKIVCGLVEGGGADFIKTCTGFAEGKATVEDILLFRANLSERVQIKASAGIRDRATAIALITAGATRLGTSSTAAILGQGGPASGY